MWKKFRQGELHFSTEYNKTSFRLQKKVSTIITVMQPRCNDGRSLEQTSLWADFRACDIEDTGTQDVTKRSSLVTGCQPVGTHVSDRKLQCSYFTLLSILRCEM
jgi:hypothetical protein